MNLKKIKIIYINFEKEKKSKHLVTRHILGVCSLPNANKLMDDQLKVRTASNISAFIYIIMFVFQRKWGIEVVFNHMILMIWKLFIKLADLILSILLMIFRSSK